jgi:hypothetical protein
VKIDFGFQLPNFILLLHSIKVSCLIPTGSHFSLIKRGNFNFTLIGLTSDTGEKVAIAKSMNQAVIARTAGNLIRRGILT